MFLISPELFAQDCAADVDLAVTYQQTVEHHENKQQSEFSLIRTKNTVLQIYPGQGVSYKWYLMKNNKVSLARYFHQAKRAIEYQPSEITGAHTWQDKRQLISLKMINEMTLVSSQGQGCDLIQRLKLSKGDEQYLLAWQPALGLVKRLVISNEEVTQTWQAVFVSQSQAEIKQELENLQHFEATDYTDIGDNESDPFLAKMIHQGFNEQPSNHHSH